jgi:hypothetical protein
MSLLLGQFIAARGLRSCLMPRLSGCVLMLNDGLQCSSQDHCCSMDGTVIGLLLGIAVNIKACNLST